MTSKKLLEKIDESDKEFRAGFTELNKTMSTIGIAIQQKCWHPGSIGWSRNAKSYANAFISNISGSNAPASNAPASNASVSNASATNAPK